LGQPRWKRAAFRSFDRFVPTVPYRFLPPRQTVRTTYEVILDREPEAAALDHFERALHQGRISRHGLAESLIHSEEARRSVPITDVLLSMHVSRCEFVRGLPRASRIIDLGGTHQGYPDGALVHLGYPYRFDRLLVVDLPPGERHAIYQGGGGGGSVQSPLGPVEFAFHSMAELARYPDSSFDLVYSGQSIEHVPQAEGETVLGEAHRILVPGGWLCVDTPNGPVWRVRSDALMNPDHRIEYSSDQLASAVERAGFEIREHKGLNYMGEALAQGRFDEVEASANPGVFASPDECLLLALVARKPMIEPPRI